jgi:hypothetical protein
MTHAILAHAGDADGALVLLLFLPAGAMLLAGLLLVFLPLTVSPFDRPVVRDEDDLAEQLLGEEEARRLRSRGRRQRSLRRLAVRRQVAGRVERD